MDGKLTGQEEAVLSAHSPQSHPPELVTGNQNLSLYEDKVFPLPENFHDDYEGRIAAASQEMGIAEDMDLIYDLKMLKDGQESRLKKTYECMLNRMDSLERKQFEDFYAPITEEFYKLNLKGKELAEWKYQRYMRDYMKVVKSLDDNVGRILDYLEDKGMLENTLVVYTSDQGFYMGEHGWFDKRFMYEESMHTPLLMHLPKGLKAKGEIREMVQNIDYAPTFLELAGIPVPEDMHGVSLLPLLRGEHPVDWRKALYYHFMNIRQSIWLNVITEYGQIVSNLFIFTMILTLGSCMT